MLHLFATRRFGPLFVTQFLGAFNDNLYKTAMLFLITYHLLAARPEDAAVMVSLAGGVFILPFVLFSSLAGELADSVDKARVVRLVKLAEIGIMGVGAFALTHDSIALLMLVLFGMGVHSTFFGPIKYAILPQHLGSNELLTGTGLVEGGTYIAILTGQIAGGMLGAHAAWAVVAVAFVGWLTGRQVPTAPPTKAIRVNPNVVASSFRMISHLFEDRRLKLTTLAVSWFWAMGAVLTTQFVPLVKDRLHADEGVATLFLTMFSVGVALGSMTVSKLLKGKVSARYTPAAAVAVSTFTAYVVAAVHFYDTVPGVADVGTFMAHSGSWHVLIALFGMAFSAGIFVVPLYAILQTECDPGERARTIAANNIVNSAFMVAGSVIAAAMIASGLKVLDVILAVGVANLLVLPAALKLRVDRLIPLS
ncbi:MFS transporter [Sphingoaurantiacus capsulatus]|uniref:MFS transporter n=1 Tax=Sphingoaurantiacus capsulatus TaxID=1771310 RepID=A0ABV7XH56_9SPHN